MMVLYDDKQSTTRKFTSFVICCGYSLPMMVLYDDEQSTTRKFTSLVICCGYAPTTMGNVMVLTRCTYIPLNPTKGEFTRQI